MGTLKPQSNGPSHSNTVIGTLAVDGWAVTFGTARRGLGGLRPRPVSSSLDVTAHPSTASVPTSYYFNIYLMWHYNYYYYIIISSSKYIYIAQDREKLQMPWITVINGTRMS